MRGQIESTGVTLRGHGQLAGGRAGEAAARSRDGERVYACLGGPRRARGQRRGVASGVVRAERRAHSPRKAAHGQVNGAGEGGTGDAHAEPDRPRRVSIQAASTRNCNERFSLGGRPRPIPGVGCSRLRQGLMWGLPERASELVRANQGASRLGRHPRTAIPVRKWSLSCPRPLGRPWLRPPEGEGPGSLESGLSCLWGATTSGPWPAAGVASWAWAWSCRRPCWPSGRRRR